MPEQPQSFHCPTCGASLPMTAEEMVRCEYCGSNVLVPPDFRQEVETPQPEAYAPQVAIHVIDLPQAPPQLNKFVVGVIIAGVLFVILIGVISAVFAGGVGLFAASRSIDLVEDALSEQAVIPSLAPTAIPSPTPIPTQTPIPFASLVAVFDGKTGEQAQVDDPRNIAIDPQGNIYIANYGTGLIYKLNSEGQFEYLVQIDPGPNLIPFISDLAVDNAGRLYAVRGGDILKLDAVSGTQVGILPGSPPETYYTKLATDPAENLTRSITLLVVRI